MTERELSEHPGWRWCTAEGSREFDRLQDLQLTFREKLEWLEEAETLSLRFCASRDASRSVSTESPPKATAS